VSGAANHGQVRRLDLPIFQPAIKSFVVNPEVIFVVRVQIIPMQLKKLMPLLPLQVVAPLLIIQSPGQHLNSSMDLPVTTFEFTAIGLPPQTIVNRAFPGNTPMS
jgi:hypothetical protein